MNELDRLAGSVLVAGFPGGELPASIAASLRDGALAGVILFKRNLNGSLETLAELTRSIAETSELPPLSAIDQEGGRVARLGAPVVKLPAARVLGTIDEFLKVKHLEVRRGRFLTDVDNYATANVAVLAAGSAERLFKYEDPIGKEVLLGNDVYRVIGVLKPQGSGNATPGGIGQQNTTRTFTSP